MDFDSAFEIDSVDMSAIIRGGYRISPRGRRPVMDWCLNGIE